MEQNDSEMTMDASDLYREDTFTDRKVGTIRRLTPVTANGADDASRVVIYSGETQIMTPGGALPLNFEIPAADLSKASEKFGMEAQVALEKTVKQIEEMRREQASSIIVPGQGGGPAGGLSGY
ncbi:MAG: hypothetical protein ACI90U_001317 [Pseudomonadales bacterium]|jgi:hypothetical protein